jgi:CobQ-like glutamine amidotransferase family enzyme
MRTNELDVNHTQPVSDGRNQSKVVTFDVEHHTVITEKTCAGKVSLDVCGGLPIGFARFIMPSQQRLFGRGVLGTDAS